MLFFNRKKNIQSHAATELDSKRILSKDTPFAVREAYRTLYTNILYLPIDSACKTFAVTSAFPGEGKTSISINLAYSIATNSVDSRILIIDADMRSPRVCDLLAIKKRGVHGLSEYLAGIDAEPNIISTIHDNLFLLPAGAESVNTPGLLCSKRMASLMELCKGKFDYIIFDTPPVNIVSDAILLKD
jgi:capsular exopolysaccharide synthesis family protein